MSRASKAAIGFASLCLLLAFSITRVTITPTSADAATGNTARQTVVIGRTAIGTDRVTYNVGQTQHQIFAKYSNNGGTCTVNTGTTEIILQGSFNNTDWLNITGIQTVNSSNLGVAYGYGLFPYLRVSTNQAPVDCKVDIYYAGSTPVASFPQLLTLSNNSYRYRTDTNSTTTTGSDVRISNNIITSSSKLVVYGLMLHNSGTVAATTLAINEKTTGGGTILNRLIGLGSLGVGESIALPNSTVPYFTATTAGSDLFIVFSGAGASVEWVVTYRLEY